jgi:hypothetical protein
MTVEASDDRLKRELNVDRRPRQAEDRKVTERRDISDDDRLDMFRAQLFNDALPDLPEIPGYHVCWLTTTNPRDTIHRRQQLGYEPVRPDEIPGMEYATLKTGEWSGLIGVNEMLAFKLPERLYQAFMKEAHYDAPLREEGKLTDTLDSIKDQAARAGGTILEGDGMQDLRDFAPAPRSFA